MRNKLLKTRKQSARLRQKTLERLYAALVEKHNLLLVETDPQSVGEERNLRCETADVVDMAANASDQEIRCRVAAQQWEEIVGIEEAFRKIEDGTYGICEACDAHIRVPRLRAMPYARLCLHCQQTRERSADVEDEVASWETIRASCGDESRSQFHGIGTATRY